MKNQILVFILLSPLFVFSQNTIPFEMGEFEIQFLNYNPQQKPEVSDKTYNYGKMIVEETKKSVENNPENFNLADYFNVLSAFLSLNESKENIDLAFQKFVQADGSCEYIIGFEEDIQKNAKYDIIREDYNQQLAICKNAITKPKEFILEDYCEQYHLDLSLVQLIQKVDSDDQKYRKESGKTDSKNQNQLDVRNQLIIDSLYKIHNTYIGRSLVGKKYESVMWAVIQHSSLEIMGEYLDIVHQAVKSKELSPTPFKMLIDRYYGLKYGYQIFGSQSGFGFKMATQSQKEEFERRYGSY